MVIGIIVYLLKFPHWLYCSDKKHLYLGHIRSHTGRSHSNAAIVIIGVHNQAIDLSMKQWYGIGIIVYL